MVTIVVLGTGCQERTPAKVETEKPASPSVGREYGEALRGAIGQANSAKSTLEASARTLEETDKASQ